MHAGFDGADFLLFVDDEGIAILDTGILLHEVLVPIDGSALLQKQNVDVVPQQILHRNLLLYLHSALGLIFLLLKVLQQPFWIQVLYYPFEVVNTPLHLFLLVNQLQNCQVNDVVHQNALL